MTEWEYSSLRWRKHSSDLVAFFLMTYILDLCPAHIACSGYNLNSGGKLSTYIHLQANFSLNGNDRNCLNLFFPDLHLLAREC